MPRCIPHPCPFISILICRITCCSTSATSIEVQEKVESESESRSSALRIGEPERDKEARWAVVRGVGDGVRVLMCLCVEGAEEGV